MVNAVNTADVAKAASAATKAGTKLGKNIDDFLLLLTTQLKNQDPSEPMKTEEFTQQLASLSAVEQQIATNKNLETMLSSFSAQQNSAASTYIGRQIEAEGKRVQFDGSQATLSYSLAAAADKVTVTVADSSGKILYTAEGGKNAGRNSLLWDGTDRSGQKVPVGSYTIAVAAKDANGKDVATTTYTTGQVSGVQIKDGKPMLQVGDEQISLDKVLSTHEGSNVSQLTSLSGYVGKWVESPGNNVAFNGRQAMVTYTLPSTAASAKIRISDADGQLVFQGDGATASGRNQLIWDGTSTNNGGSGNALPPGIYTVEVEARDAAGKSIPAATRSTGQVQSVDIDRGKITLATGPNNFVPIEQVLSVREG